MLRTKSVLLVAMLAAGTLAGCSKSSGGGGGNSAGGATGSTKTVTLGGQQANDHGTATISSNLGVKVTANDFYFSPTVILGQPGQEGTIVVHNASSSTLHNFSITSANIDQDVQPGTQQEIHVTFPASGVLVFFCKYHQSSGMVGALQVSGAAAGNSSGGSSNANSGGGGYSNNGGGGGGYGGGY